MTREIITIRENRSAPAHSRRRVQTANATTSCLTGLIDSGRMQEKICSKYTNRTSLSRPLFAAAHETAPRHDFAFK